MFGNPSHAAEHGPSDQRSDRKAVEQASPGPPPLPADAHRDRAGADHRLGQRRGRADLRRRLRQHASRDGANFAFGDGSVRFLKQTIDQAVYRRLGHRSDGELIDDEAY